MKLLAFGGLNAVKMIRTAFSSKEQTVVVVLQPSPVL